MQSAQESIFLLFMTYGEATNMHIKEYLKEYLSSLSWVGITLGFSRSTICYFSLILHDLLSSVCIMESHMLNILSYTPR